MENKCDRYYKGFCESATGDTRCNRRCCFHCKHAQEVTCAMACSTALEALVPEE